MSQTITELAKAHQIKCYLGKHSLTKSKHNKRQKEVNCHVCKRPMTAPDFENGPFYCYKCDCEAEAALRFSE